MNTLMMTLQQPISVAALVQCLGLGVRKPAAPSAQRSRRRRERTRLLTSQPAAPDQPARDDDGVTPGCGWFDSSHELHQGLEVREHAGAEGLGSELPLTIWLGLVLDGVAEPVASGHPPALALRA